MQHSGSESLNMVHFMLGSFFGSGGSNVVRQLKGKFCPLNWKKL